MPTIYTVGHSNRDLEPFLDLLAEFGIGFVADIRRFPSSRAFPHFNKGSLQQSLQERGVGYRWVEAMGGRRHGEDASRQTGLSSPAFRSYAEHMNAGVFRGAAAALLEACAETRVAVMCAEKLFWKCHRLLVSDYFTTAGARVVHILEQWRSQEHQLSPQVRMGPDGSILYTSEDGE
jgi:uncharacterized protein (DUF488 family)